MKHDDKNQIISEKSLEKTANTVGSISKVVVGGWAILGVVAGLVSFAVLYNVRPLFEANNLLTVRVDAVEKKDIQIEQKLDRIETNMETRFNTIEEKIDETNRYLRK